MVFGYSYRLCGCQSWQHISPSRLPQCRWVGYEGSVVNLWACRKQWEPIHYLPSYFLWDTSFWSGAIGEHPEPRTQHDIAVGYRHSRTHWLPDKDEDEIGINESSITASPKLRASSFRRWGFFLVGLSTCHKAWAVRACQVTI